MNIAFFGTSDRSNPILNSLYKSFELVLCLTKSDTKVGRRMDKRETGVKIWARQNDVPCLEIENIRNDKSNIVKALKEGSVELGVVADFGFIIPKTILEAPKYGLVNIHFSLLPKYRGASPVQFALLEGADVTGITFHLVSKELDEGNIVHQIEYKIRDNITSGELYDELFEEAAKHLPKVINDYVNKKIVAVPQDNSKASYTSSKTHPDKTYIFKDDARIDWKLDTERIVRMIKAFNPWPVAWTTLSELSKALGNELRDGINPKLIVKIHEGYIDSGELKIGKLQVEGKKIMSWDEFKNGYLK